jgi:hypothetical protein
MTHRDRHQEIAPRKANEALDFVVPPARPAKAVLEQIVRLEFREDSRSLPFAIPQDARNRYLGVVVRN